MGNHFRERRHIFSFLVFCDRMLKHSSMLAFMVDSDGGCVYVSPNWESITGVPPQRVLGSHLHGALHPDEWHDMHDYFTGAAEPTNGKVEFRITHPEGWHWFQADIMPFNAQMLGLDMMGDYRICMAHDVHAKYVKEKLDTAHQPMPKEIGTTPTRTFLSQINHDFRTPLNAIIGFSEMIRSETFGPINNKYYQEYVQHIHESGEDLLHTIDSMLQHTDKQAKASASKSKPTTAQHSLFMTESA